MKNSAQVLRKPALPYDPSDYLTGRRALPPWFKYKKQRFYVYAFQNVATAVFPVNEITLDSDSFFLLEGVNIVTNPSADSSVTLNIQFSDTSKGQPWSVGNLVFRNMTGRGDNTKMFATPTLLRPTTSIIFSTNNTSTQPVYGSLIGRKVYGLLESEARFLLRRMWYCYDIPFAPLAASDTNTFQVQTYADSDFYMWQMYCSQGIGFTNTELKAGNNPAELMVILRDATTNKNLMNRQAPIRLVTGSMVTNLDTTPTPDVYTLGTGFQLTIPAVVKRNSTLILEITNQDASTAIGTVPFNFTMEGCRVFD